MLIISAIPQHRGWSPIQHAIALASELLECNVIAADTRLPTNISKTLALLRGRAKGGVGTEDCLLVCAGPGDLLRLLRVADWRRRFRHLAAWVIDSFWVDHMPLLCRLSCPFDQVFVTTAEDVDRWKKITGVRATWLPWGTDALRYGSGAGEREWDITRVGRQPPEWEDDDETGVAAQRCGIRYRGRPGSDGMNALQNQQLMMNVYSSSKYILAFSNTAHLQHYTHPTQQYLTGRWVDAVACGAIVAGTAPRGPSADQLLWPGALLDFGSVRREDGLGVLQDALRSWSPKIAARNYEMALRQLDWRWRLQSLAHAYGASPQSLAREVALLKQRIAGLSEEGSSLSARA